MKRICLFAGYNYNSIVAKYVVRYISELSKLSDVYYLADCETPQSELDKLRNITKAAYSYRHEKYDFGSWQDLINKIGWEKLSEYDELIFTNDSSFGPFHSLQNILDKAEYDKEWGLFGISAGIRTGCWDYLQSYFLVFRNEVFMSGCFRKFIDGIKKEQNKDSVVSNYEVELTKILTGNSFKAKRLIKKRYDNHYYWKSLLKAGSPFLRIANFRAHQNDFKGEAILNIDVFLEPEFGYDKEYIYEALKYRGVDYNFFKEPRYLLSYLKRNIVRCLGEFANQLLCVHYSKKKQKWERIRIFGINIIEPKYESLTSVIGNIKED